MMFVLDIKKLKNYGRDIEKEDQKEDVFAIIFLRDLLLAIFGVFLNKTCTSAVSF